MECWPHSPKNPVLGIASCGAAVVVVTGGGTCATEVVGPVGSVNLGGGCRSHGRQINMNPAARITATTAAAAAIRRAFTDFVAPELGCGGSGAGLVGAAWVGASAESICSSRAWAKSEQRLNRSSARLARPTARTGSNAVNSDRLSANAGGGTLRWRLMTTAGLEFGNI
jgi:hypothetical protein